MNHYDDRISYFALLNEQGKYLDMLDTNQQADISMCVYGGTSATVTQSYVETIV